LQTLFTKLDVDAPLIAAIKEQRSKAMSAEEWLTEVTHMLPFDAVALDNAS